MPPSPLPSSLTSLLPSLPCNCLLSTRGQMEPFTLQAPLSPCGHSPPFSASLSALAMLTSGLPHLHPLRDLCSPHFLCPGQPSPSPSWLIPAFLTL